MESVKATGILMLGTIRADGRPRISPCEAFVVDGDLMLGMMWQSKKALDLIRDPRITMVTTQCEREPAHGDVKLYGKVSDVAEPERRKAYADTLEAAINWRPSEPYHLFAADIQSAGYISFGKDQRLLRWSAGHRVEVLRHPDAAEEEA